MTDQPIGGIRSLLGPPADHAETPTQVWQPSLRSDEQTADRVCEHLRGRTHHVINAAELMVHARQAVHELRQSISPESLAEMACLLVITRLDMAGDTVAN